MNYYARHDLSQDIWVKTGVKDGRDRYERARVEGICFVPGRVMYEVIVDGFSTLVPEIDTFATWEEVYWATHKDKWEDS